MPSISEFFEMIYSQPTAITRSIRGGIGLTLAFFLWSNCVLIPFGLSFYVYDEPLNELKKINLDVPFMTALLSTICSAYIGGTLSPILCNFIPSRIRWMVFTYSFAGAMASIAISSSLAVSAMMILQTQVGRKAYEYTFVLAGIVGFLSGFLGGFLAGIVLNWKIRKLKNYKTNAL